MEEARGNRVRCQVEKEKVVGWTGCQQVVEDAALYGGGSTAAQWFGGAVAVVQPTAADVDALEKIKWNLIDFFSCKEVCLINLKTN